jgi:hypothetical protein
MANCQKLGIRGKFIQTDASSKVGGMAEERSLQFKDISSCFSLSFLLILCDRIIDCVEVFLRKSTGAGGRKPPFLAATPVCHLFRVGACREAGPGIYIINKNSCPDNILTF